MKRIYLGVTVVGAALLGLSSCGTSSFDHFVGSDPGSDLPWGMTHQEVAENMGTFYDLATEFPFLLTYRVRWTNNTAGLSLTAANEEVTYRFNDRGLLYQVEISYSSGFADTGSMTADIDKRAERVTEKLLKRYGVPDEDSPSTWMGMPSSTVLWNNAPLGTPERPTTIEIAHTSWPIDGGPLDHMSVFTETYTSPELAPAEKSVFEHVIAGNDGALADTSQQETGTTISCSIIDRDSGSLSRRRFAAITPLYLALTYTDGSEEELVAALIEAGADVNQPVSILQTDETKTDYPLIKAVFEKQIEVARLLLAAGADPEQKGNFIVRTKDDSPLNAREIAAIHDDEELLALFAEAEDSTEQ